MKHKEEQRSRRRSSETQKKVTNTKRSSEARGVAKHGGTMKQKEEQ
jgi:hypothetical protein